ncbi:MAG: hypothetical protein ACRCT1_02670 [Microcoleaceae cyanobacterium]|jgi:hypothetical protein
MANLSEENLRRITHLLPRLFEVINLATATEFNLFTQYGETEETLPELGAAEGAAERQQAETERQQAETERQRVAQLESLLAQYRDRFGNLLTRITERDRFTETRFLHQISTQK